MGQGPEHLVDAVPDFERQHRAVLVTDVVGYARLMEADEVGTHARYRRLRVGVIDPTIISHRGELIKNTGDGFVAVFESPRDAIRCTTELQQRIGNLEGSQPPERRITFRTGVSWEPIIFDMDDVYGHGVNMAARLQSVASPGGIVVSSSLLGALGDVRDLQLDDLGELRLKNLSRPIHAFAFILPGVDRGATLGLPGTSAGWAKLPSIAVLPFKNFSSEPQDAYFAEGFADDIISSLSNIPELLIVSRGSTMAFRQRAIDPIEIGERLGVQYFAAGSVRRMNSNVRLSVELVDVSTACVLWSDKYDLGIEEVFSAQDDIAINIMGKIANHVRRAEVKRALRKAPHSLNAYDYLLRALDALYKLDFANFSRARALLEKARTEDDSYAAPYAFGAHWHMFNIAEGWSSDVDADAAEVIRLSECAIERDPSNSLALAIQGHGRGMFFRDYDSAIDLVERAIAVSPSNSWAWIFSSGPFGFIGETESAIARAERAIRLSPIDQQAFFNYCLLGQNHYLNGNYNDAVRWSRKALSLNPRFGNAARVLASSLVAIGRVDDALRIGKHHARILPSFRVSDYERRCPFKQPQASLYVDRLRAAGIPT